MAAAARGRERGDAPDEEGAHGDAAADAAEGSESAARRRASAVGRPTRRG